MTPWTVAYQTPSLMVFSRLEYWSGLLFPSPMHESEKWKWSGSVLSTSLWPHGLYPWNSPGQNTGVGSLSLLQEIFPTQESNWGPLHCRQILYQLSYEGSPDYKWDMAKSEAQAFPLFNQLLKDAVSFCADIKGKKHNNDLEVLEAYCIQIFPLSNFLTIFILQNS